MRALRKILVSSLVAAAAFVCAPSSAVGGGPRIHETGAGYWLYYDGGLEVATSIDRGLLKGDLNLSGVLGAVGQDDLGNLVFGGTIVAYTRHGVLVLSTSDLSSDGGNSDYALGGEVSAHATVTGGSGLFEGATGEFYLHGRAAGDGVLEFDEISGTLDLHGQ